MGSQAANIGGEDSIRSAYGLCDRPLPVATWRYAVLACGRQRSGGCFELLCQAEQFLAKAPSAFLPARPRTTATGRSPPPSLSWRYQRGTLPADSINTEEGGG